MLGKWPFPNKLSEMLAWAGGLWIRRVLVRAQEGQLETRSELGFGRVSAFSDVEAVAMCTPATARERRVVQTGLGLTGGAAFDLASSPVAFGGSLLPQLYPRIEEEDGAP